MIRVGKSLNGAVIKKGKRLTGLEECLKRGMKMVKGGRKKKRFDRERGSARQDGKLL